MYSRMKTEHAYANLHWCERRTAGRARVGCAAPSLATTTIYGTVMSAGSMARGRADWRCNGACRRDSATKTVAATVCAHASSWQPTFASSKANFSSQTGQADWAGPALHILANAMFSVPPCPLIPPSLWMQTPSLSPITISDIYCRFLPKLRPMYLKCSSKCTWKPLLWCLI